MRAERSPLRAGLLIALAFAGLPHAARAQIQPEGRVDVIGPAPVSIEPGVGVNVFAGNYVRVGAIVAYNARQHPDLEDGLWRGDLLARVSLDPFRQKRWGLSLGGGLTFRPRVVRLAVVLDLEGPAIRTVLPALQVGMSGGFRAGVVVRRAVPRRR